MPHHIIRRMSALTVWVLSLVVLFPMVFWGVWLNFMSDSLRCEHASEGEIRCVTDSTGPAGGSRTVTARGAVGAEIATLVSHRGGRTSTSPELQLVTAKGTVGVSVSTFAMQTPPARRELAEKLDAFVRNPSAPPLALTLRPGIGFRIVLGLIGLVGLLGLAALGRDTRLEIDPSQNLVVKRRVWGFVHSSVETPLHQVIGIEAGARVGRRVKALLMRHNGDPIDLGNVTLFNAHSVSRARAFVEAAKRGD